MKLFRVTILSFCMVVMGWSLVVAQRPFPEHTRDQVIRSFENLEEIRRRVDTLESNELPVKIAVIDDRLNSLRQSLDEIRWMLWTGLAGLLGLVAEAAFRVFLRR